MATIYRLSLSVAAVVACLTTQGCKLGSSSSSAKASDSLPKSATFNFTQGTVQSQISFEPNTKREVGIRLDYTSHDTANAASAKSYYWFEQNNAEWTIFGSDYDETPVHKEDLPHIDSFATTSKKQIVFSKQQLDVVTALLTSGTPTTTSGDLKTNLAAILVEINVLKSVWNPAAKAANVSLNGGDIAASDRDARDGATSDRSGASDGDATSHSTDRDTKGK